MLKTVFFDLDGTLIDTELNAAEAVKRCFTSWGIEIDPNDAGHITGRTWESALRFLFGKYKLQLPHEEATEKIKEEYRLSIKENLSVVPGSVDAIRALSEKYPLGLVSGSNRLDIFWALENLGIRSKFQVILGAEDYPRSKPEPDGYLKALELLQIPAHEALIFEDSQAGIFSALAAGAWVVAVTATNHFNQDVSKAHHQIPDLTCVNCEWAEQIVRRHQK